MKKNFLKTTFILSKKDIKNLLFQRNELLSTRQKFLRKKFGRFLFTKIFVMFFIKKNINKLYYQIISREVKMIFPFIKNLKKKNILSIGCGLGGFEVILQKNYLTKSNFFLFDRNFTSDKVVYGYDVNNREAYNNIKDTNLFINNNSIDRLKFKLFDVDKDKLPSVKFDLVISILSLDYHYPFDIYYNYLKKNSNNSTVFIFDTIRPDYFKKIFKVIKVISMDKRKIHSSSRIYCTGLL